jgi:uncharacterized membrane protein
MLPLHSFLIPIFFLPILVILLIFIILIPFLIIYFFLRVTEEAFELIGFKTRHAILMTVGALLGSFIDIPILHYRDILIAVNLGGSIIPVLITFEIFIKRRVSLKRAFIGIFIVTLVSYYIAEPVRGIGIVMPFYVSPIMAGICGALLGFNQKNPPALAYVSGTMGTLIGADLLNIFNRDVLDLLSRGLVGTLSIGGAGIFDGIFLTGVLSVFLAALVSHSSTTPPSRI